MTDTSRNVLLPQLGMGMAEGTIVEWLVADGAWVERDEPMLMIETEKVTTEIPAPSAGFIRLIAAIGETHPIETVIATLSIKATSEPAVPAENQSLAKRTDDQPHPTSPASNSDSSVPKAKRIIASGLAKSIARINDIDLSSVVGSGPRGRVVKKDVLARLSEIEELRSAARPSEPPSEQRAKLRETPAPPALTQQSSGGMRATIPMTGIRKTIADRMVRSSTEAAQTFVFFEIDVTELLRVRGTLDDRAEANGDGRISAMAYYAKAVALACRRVPIANATVNADEITIWDDVNIGIAVAMPGATEYDSSLIVPVVHRANELGIGALNEQIRGQVKKAREGKLTASDLANGTITISSNAGFFPGMWVYSTPLLNMPQAVIFQPGNATKRAVVVDDEIVIRTILPCSLTFDHRCLDGEPTARFIRALTEFLTTPESMLL